MTKLLRGMGVKGRLLLAFFGISALAVLGAVAALFAFFQIGSVVDRLTREQVPAGFAALELSRQADRIAMAAPRLLADTTAVQQLRTDRLIRTELAGLEKLFAQVKAAQPDITLTSDIERSVTEIRQNLAGIQLIRDVWQGASSPGFSGEAGEWSRGPEHRSNTETLPPGGLLAKAHKLIESNNEASARLSKAVNLFIEKKRAEVAEAEADVAATQRRSTGILIAVVALSLASSALIVWLYVGRSIIGRLTALSGSMLAIAGGNIGAPLPVSGGKDEIDRMVDALHTFRDTAIESEKLARLKHFLAPQVAELIVSSGDETVLESHRREIAVLFCDLRGFTAFAESAEPEEIMRLLRDYHASLGQLVHKFAGTLERFTGDGLIVLFNDPLPCPDPCLTASRLAVEMRTATGDLIQRWRQLGSRLGFGVGIAYGYATLGRVGFEGRFEYTAIGSVVNLAARLCERAKDGEILIDSKVHAAIEGIIETEALSDFIPKGLSRPVEVFNILGANDHRLSAISPTAS